MVRFRPIADMLRHVHSGRMNRRLKLLAMVIVGAWAGLAQSPAVGQTSTAAEQRQPRVVNVTTDSEPGWVPSIEQEHEAIGMADAFFAALEKGDYSSAYQMMSDGQRALVPRDTFDRNSSDFRNMAGPVRVRTYTKVTWTKDSAAAPHPGIYVAIDLAAKYAKIDRYCGYIVLSQADPSMPFQVARTESNFITDSVAANAKSDAELDAAWEQLSSNCPNYPKPELPETESSTIGYDTVAAALQDLRSRPGVIFTTENGWTIATDKAAYTIWSFAPEDYPAYPSVVKRSVVSEGTGSIMKMDVHCEASKTACDDLVRTFSRMNSLPGPK